MERENAARPPIARGNQGAVREGEGTNRAGGANRVGGRYRVRTCDPYHVKVVLYR